MANQHKLEVSKREDLSKQGLKMLRKEGNVPGVFYEAKSKNSISFYISKKEIFEAIKSNAKIFTISVGKDTKNVIFKSVQYHPVNDEIIHIDLYGVQMDKPVNIKVSIHLEGSPIGVRESGGVLSQAINEIEVSCLPLDIPEKLDVNVDDLDMGSTMLVSDVEIGEKLTLISNPDLVIASVTQAMQEIETVEEEETDEFMEDGESADTDDKEGGDQSASSDDGSKEDANKGD